jgi:hypothetical protein
MVPDAMENDTPVLKTEPLVPKIHDNPSNILMKKTDAAVIGRASLKGILKEDMDDFHQKSKNLATKPEETKSEKKEETKEPMMGLEGSQQTKVPLKTIDQLLIHNSDTAVKPIIGNKDIEKASELVFNA